MDENLFACLDDDLRFDEPVRKKKRSSILKQSKCLDPDVCNNTEVEYKKRTKEIKRVSFANKFQVKEMNTGNIYDIPGQIETPKEYIPNQDVTGADDDKENLGILLRNNYPAAFPDSFSMAPEFSFNQSSEAFVNKEVKANDSLLVFSSPASDDMELTQMDKSIFPSPSPERPSCAFYDESGSHNRIFAQKMGLTQESITCNRYEIPNSKIKEFVTENDIFEKKRSADGVSLPDMNMSYAAAVKNAPELALFSSEMQEKLILESRDSDVSLGGNISISETTCTSVGLSKHRKSDVILSSSMLRSGDTDNICESCPITQNKNDYIFNENLYLQIEPPGEKDALRSRKRKVYENPLKDTQSYASGEKPAYSFSGYPVGKPNVKVTSLNFKEDSSPLNFMEMTCVSTKGDFENSEDNSLPGALQKSAHRGADLNMTCLTSIDKQGETDVFQENLNVKYNLSKEHKNIKEKHFPSNLPENTQGAELDMTCVSTIEKEGRSIDGTYHRNILSFKCNSPNKYEDIEENSLPGILLENTQGGKLDMTCVATIGKEGRSVETDDIYHENSFPGILQEKAADLDMTCMTTFEKKGYADAYPENTLSIRCNSPKKYVRSNEGSTLPGTLLRNTLGNDLDMTCVATGEKIGGLTEDIFNDDILNRERSSFEKNLGKVQSVNYVEKAKSSQICDSNSLGLRSDCETSKDLILSVNANINEPFTSGSSGYVEDIYSQKTVKQSHTYITNVMEFTCAVNASIDESCNEDTQHEARKHTRFINSSIMDMTCPENASAEKEISLSEGDISLSNTLNKEFTHEKLDGLNASRSSEIPSQIVKPGAIKVNDIFHDEDDEKMAAQYSGRDCPYGKVDAEDSVQHCDSELMQLTCANMSKRFVAAHPELEITMAEKNEAGDSLSELCHLNQNLIPDTMEVRMFEDGKDKSLKRSCTDNDINDADSSVVKRTKSRTPAIVYRMRRTKVTTEDVQKEIYLTPELEKVMNHRNVFGTEQDASIFSVGNLKGQKSSSVGEQSIITTKVTNESELFSSSILQSNEEAVLNISRETNIDSDQASSSKLISSTHTAVSSKKFCTNKINESEISSYRMLQSNSKPVQLVSCKTNMESDQSISSKLVTATPKEDIFSTNSLTASESLSDHRVKKSFKALSPSKEESKSGRFQLENECSSHDQDNSKPATGGTPRAVTSEIFSANVLNRREIQKPNLQRETEMESSVKLNLKVSSLSKEESRSKDYLIENTHNSLNRNDQKFVSAIPKAESSKFMCTSEIQKRETKDSFITSSPSKEESKSGGSRLENVGKKNEQSKGMSLVSDKISVLSASDSEKLSLRDREKPVSSFCGVIESVPRRESTATKVMTPKLSNSVRKQTSTKNFSFGKEKSSSDSLYINKETILDDEVANVSNSLHESSVIPQSENSFGGEIKSSLDQDKDLVTGSSNSMLSGTIPKLKIEDSVLQTSKAFQNLSRNVSSSIKYLASFNQTGIPGESTVNESYSLQLLPESLLNDSISLCGSGVTKEKSDLQASTLFDCSLTAKRTKALNDPSTIAEEREVSISSREESAVESSNSRGQSDALPESFELKSPDRKNPSSPAEVDSFNKPYDSPVEINKETEQSNADKIDQTMDKPSDDFIESKGMCHLFPVKDSNEAVEKGQDPDCSPVCNNGGKEMDPVNINLSDGASSNSSIEPVQNSLSVLTKKIEEAAGSKKRWFLVSLRENKAVFQLNWKSYLFWCKLKIQMDRMSSTESKISFSYKSRGEEIEDFGYKCFLHFMSEKSVPFPVCSEEIITKIEEYAELARKVEVLMNDVMHLILFFKTTVSEGFNPIRIKTEVLNDNLVSKFSLTYEVDFNSYPQKVVPKVEHLRLRNYTEKVREAVATVEPGPRYLWKMASLAQNISC